MTLLRRLWAWVATCARPDCAAAPVFLGWCEDHAPDYEPGPDEYWGDE